MYVPFVDLTRQSKNLKVAIDKKILETIKSGQFVLGKELVNFEKEFASYIGTTYCRGVASGSDALLLALVSLGITRGDEVIVPDMTFIATALPVLHLGARPVLVDILPDQPLIDPDKIEKAITSRTKAIIVVHLHGHPCNMYKILKVARHHNIALIEDACQAHGSSINIELKTKNEELRTKNQEQRTSNIEPRTKNQEQKIINRSENIEVLSSKSSVRSWKMAGSVGHIGCFSFYPAKNLGGYGDGGAVVSSNKDLIENITLLRNYGQKEKYNHVLAGFNSRLDSLQAAVLQVKLKYLNESNKKRRVHAAFYNSQLSHLPIKLPEEESNCKTNYHIYQIQTSRRDKLIKYLANNNIKCQIHYPIPLHLQPALTSLGYPKEDFPNCRKFAQQTLSLPLFPELTREELYAVTKRISLFFN